MKIETILDLMDETIDKAWSLPLSGGRCVVDVERIQALIDDIRMNLPTEIMQAKAIAADRVEILAQARREADQLMRRAEEQAKKLIDRETVVKQAKSKANDIMSQAQVQSRELRHGAQNFSDDTLRKAEEALTNSLTEVRSTRQALRNSRN